MEFIIKNVVYFIISKDYFSYVTRDVLPDRFPITLHLVEFLTLETYLNIHSKLSLGIIYKAQNIHWKMENGIWSVIKMEKIAKIIFIIITM